MNIRPYTPDDADTIIGWSTDKRTHELWCAGRFPYPADSISFNDKVRELRDTGETPLTAVDDNDIPVGFCCYSLNTANGMGMLKFVIISSEQRGKGYGREMLRLALSRAFEDERTEKVQLNVFSVNERARKCYASAGFTERSVTENAFMFGEEAWGRVNMTADRQ